MTREQIGAEVEAMRGKLKVTLRQLPGDVEDHVQEVMIATLLRFDPSRGVKVSTFAYTVAKGYILEVRRKRSPLSRQGLVRPKFVALTKVVEEYVEDPHAFDTDLFDAELSAMLDSLNLTQRERMVLEDFASGKNMSQVANLYGHGPTWAHQMLYSVRRRNERFRPKDLYLA